MALPIAYLWLDGYAKRLLLVGFAVTVAYLSNGFRIAIVGFLNYTGLSNSDLGALHLLEGLATSLVSYLLIFGFLSLLSRLSPAASTDTVDDAAAGPATVQGGVRRFGFDAGMLAIVVMSWVYMATFRPVQVPLDDALQALPHQIDQWTFDPFVADDSGYRLSGVDEEVTRAYRSANGDRVRLYVGYQRFQQEGKEVTDIASRELLKLSSPVEIAGARGSVHLGEVVQEAEGRRRGTLLWVDLNGRTVTDAYRAKAYTFWDAITRRRTNGAIVLVEWDASVADFDASRREALGFVRSLWPYLSDRIPS
jgi:EpsI family protein